MSSPESLPLLDRQTDAPRAARRVGLVAGSVVGLAALCGLVVVTFNAGRLRGEADMASFKASVAGEPLRVAAESDTYAGYGNMTKYPFLAEGYGVLVEPHRSSVLRVGNPKAWATYAWHVGATPKASLSLTAVSKDVEVHEGEDAVRVTRTETGVYSLVLVERVQGVETRRLGLNLYCKYVRRELRDLTAEDREKYLDAAATLWHVSTKAGREKEQGYSSQYRDINSLAVIHNDLAGNTVCDHLHGEIGYAFLTGHVALNNMLEQSLQAVDPSVSLAYWEYSRETKDCAGSGDSACYWEIWDSEVFTSTFFGAKGSKGHIADGRWAETTVPVVDAAFFDEAMIEGHYRTHSYAGCYGQDSADAGCDIESRQEFRHTDDETNAFTKWSDKHVVNAYGLLRSPWNMNSDRHVVRSGDMCGAKNDAQFPDCESIITQQAAYDTFADWVLQMQFSPHGATHLFIGGAFGTCSETLASVKDDVSAATFHRLLGKSADLMKNMYWFNMIDCPSRDSCADLIADGANEASGCVCSCPSLHGASAETTDHSFWESNAAFQYVMRYLSPDMRKEVQALSHETKFLLMQSLCDSNILLGDMLTSNSPLDVSFFNIHAEVERIWQRKALSGTLTDLSWPYPAGYSAANPACPGQTPGYKMRWHEYVFDGEQRATVDALGKKTGKAYSTNLRNDEFLKILTPTDKAYAEAVPYVYAQFRWDSCSIPKDDAAYMDSSLMAADAWVGAEDVAWLQELAEAEEEEEEESSAAVAA